MRRRSFICAATAASVGIPFGAAFTPEQSFVRILQRAQERKVDLLALVGDIFSFPSEAAIDWVGGKLEDAKVPYLYVAGNHDWHYEGMQVRSIDVINGIPQFVTDDNASGAFMDVEFLPRSLS